MEDTPRRRVSDNTIPGTGLDPNEMALLKAFCAPALFWHILAMLHSFGFPSSDVHSVEYFAGEGQVTRNMRMHNKVSIAFDIAYDIAFDTCSPIGFLLAIALARRASGLHAPALAGLTRSRKATARFSRSGRATFRPPDQL